MPSLHFISPKYQEELGGLQTWGRGNKRRAHKIQNAFYTIVLGATSGVQEPEDFLFMAFILGILELWEDSITMADHARQIDGIVDPAEVSYFLAFTKRRLAMTASNNVQALGWYVAAYQEILNARSTHEEDYRYLKEQAAIILLYLETSYLMEQVDAKVSNVPREERPRLEVGIEDAKVLLRRALHLVGSDLSRVVEILNNLAYAETLSVPFSMDSAEAYLTQIDHVMITAGEPSEQILQGFGPHFDDTRIMINAKYAWNEKNTDALGKCLAEMNEILKRRELTDSERSIFKMHRRILQNMLQALTQSS